ncbi:MAG: hypothetical protein EOP34_02790 [Rickettsiales bacterium]|nr:MAG: hypothetical protein EOP34_02790 [Rickettsiales bacterium]
MSKIYNKKVIFNIINLKYIHLNSDILTQAVTLKLKNYRKNRVTKVLRRLLDSLQMAKINIYTYDIHSPAYKYIEKHFNKFKTLNLQIFNSKLYNTTHKQQSTGVYTASTIKKLNHTQASTINFIKYKSVFGVRLEAAGRLTKRSTASRSIFKLRYKGSLRNNSVINRSVSSVILKNNRTSNLQFSKISSKTRNGAFGLKG